MKSNIVLLTLAVLTASSIGAAAAPSLATISAQKGGATASGPAGKAVSLKPGGHLRQGTTLSTEAKSEVVFTPTPGSCISLLGKSQASLETLHYSSNFGFSPTRQAAVRLSAGGLFFGFEKGKSAGDKLDIITPMGTLQVKEGAGTVFIYGGAVHVVMQMGNGSFALGSGNPISLAGGSILKASASGAEVTNLVTGTVLTCDRAGQATGQRSATTAELTTARDFMQSALRASGDAIGSGSLSAGFTASMNAAVAQVNQALGGAGVQSVDTPAAPAAPAAPSAAVAGANFGGGGNFDAPASFSGGMATANPANLAGRVNSPER